MFKIALIDYPKINQKAIESIAKRIIYINQLSLEKYENSYTESEFEKIAVELSKVTLELELILNKLGFIVSELYSSESSIYLATQGKLLIKLKLKPSKTREFYTRIFQFVEREMSSNMFRYK